MKKTFFILSIMLTSFMFSCSNDDDDNNLNTSNIEYSPPSWIIGRWIQDFSIGTGAENGWRFTNNDFIQIAPAGIEQNHSQQVRSLSQMGAFLYDDLDGDIYSVTYSTGGPQVKLSFERIDNQSIKWIEGSFGSSEAIYLKQ
jgi:hypothetical protein